MKKILAIGGAVIKTAKEELREYIENDHVEMLIHNGGSIFHDIQQVTDHYLTDHSYPLDELIDDYSCNREASAYVWEFVNYNEAPEGSITKLCIDKNIPVLLFTGLGCDVWQLFSSPDDWSHCGRQMFYYFEDLCKRFKKPFHYICMGSAVIHPEVFIKAIAKSQAKDFKADVVDFKDMYRPKTRIAKYGTYYQMSHTEFFGGTACLI
jgi:hypothetical protein